MKKSRFTEEQIIGFVKQADQGAVSQRRFQRRDVLQVARLVRRHAGL